MTDNTTPRDVETDGLQTLHPNQWEDNMNRYDILNAAAEAVADRESCYGSPKQQFNHTAALWSAYCDCAFTADDVAKMMILLKLSRIQRDYHADSVVDIAGYASLLSEV